MNRPGPRRMNGRSYWLLTLHIIRTGKTPDGTDFRCLRNTPFSWREQRAVRCRHRGFRDKNPPPRAA